MPTIYPAAPLKGYDGEPFKTGNITDEKAKAELKEMQSKFAATTGNPQATQMLSMQIQIRRQEFIDAEPPMTLGDILMAALQQDPEKDDAKALTWDKKAQRGVLLGEVYTANKKVMPLLVEKDDIALLKELVAKIASVAMMPGLEEALSGKAPVYPEVKKQEPKAIENDYSDERLVPPVAKSEAA